VVDISASSQVPWQTNPEEQVRLDTSTGRPNAMSPALNFRFLAADKVLSHVAQDDLLCRG
jgi:hypothetical protein